MLNETEIVTGLMSCYLLVCVVMQEKCVLKLSLSAAVNITELFP